MIGDKKPPPLASTATALKIIPKAMFHLMVRSILRLSSIRKGIFEMSSFMSAMSAVSRATSVPAAPIAIPTLAAARAGASLIPSPTKMTTSPDP